MEKAHKGTQYLSGLMQRQLEESMAQGSTQLQCLVLSKVLNVRTGFY